MFAALLLLVHNNSITKNGMGVPLWCSLLHIQFQQSHINRKGFSPPCEAHNYTLVRLLLWQRSSSSSHDVSKSGASANIIPRLLCFDWFSDSRASNLPTPDVKIRVAVEILCVSKYIYFICGEREREKRTKMKTGAFYKGGGPARSRMHY